MQHQGALAYQQTTKTVETPREREAALLMKSAANLQRARDGGQGASDALDGALLYNRKIWSIFLTSVTREDNPLPAPVRENIANLGLFVLNETREMSLEPRPAKLDALISINRQLAAGLRGS